MIAGFRLSTYLTYMCVFTLFSSVTKTKPMLAFYQNSVLDSTTLSVQIDMTVDNWESGG